MVRIRSVAGSVGVSVCALLLAACGSGSQEVLGAGAGTGAPSAAAEPSQVPCKVDYRRLAAQPHRRPRLASQASGDPTPASPVPEPPASPSSTDPAGGGCVVPPGAVRCNLIDVSAIRADKTARIPLSSLDAEDRRYVFTPEDPRTFAAMVTRDQRDDAGLNAPVTAPEEMILIVNHGDWHEPYPDVGVPIAFPASGNPQPQRRPDYAWRVFLIPPKAGQSGFSSLSTGAGPCFRDGTTSG